MVAWLRRYRPAIPKAFGPSSLKQFLPLFLAALLVRLTSFEAIMQQPCAIGINSSIHRPLSLTARVSIAAPARRRPCTLHFAGEYHEEITVYLGRRCYCHDVHYGGICGGQNRRAKGAHRGEITTRALLDAERFGPGGLTLQTFGGAL